MLGRPGIRLRLLARVVIVVRFPVLATAFAAASLSLFGGSALAASPFAVEAGPKVSYAQDRVACGSQADLAWCSDTRRADAVELSLTQARSIQDRLWKRFIYTFKADAPWRSFEAAVAADKSWKAHCGGMTFTALDAMAKAGHPVEKMWRVIVNPNTRNPRDANASVLHMVGVVEIEGALYVVGDTNSPGIYPLSQADFVPLLVSPVAEGRFWRRTVREAPIITAALAN